MWHSKSKNVGLELENEIYLVCNLIEHMCVRARDGIENRGVSV